jgi:predicted secreted Zn-dependent protease
MIGVRIMSHDRLAWRKSSASAQGNCVEVAVDGEKILVRDTKDCGAGAVLAFTEAEWQAFLTGVDGYEFTLDALRQG